MKISVLAVGKIGEAGLDRLSQDYRSRLEHHIPVEARSVKKGRANDASSVMEEEAENLLSATPDRALTIAMTEEGKSLSSIDVARSVKKWMVGGRKHVVFYIGGAYGLAPRLKKEADRRWSLSALTFPHDVARMLLWEQLYRSMTIIRGEPYHK